MGVESVAAGADGVCELAPKGLKPDVPLGAVVAGLAKLKVAGVVPVAGPAFWLAGAP